MADPVILEIKAAPVLSAAHEAQLLSYPRMSGIRTGWLLNSHALRLKDGLRRVIA